MNILTVLSLGFEAMLHVERCPGAALFVLGEGHAVVGVAVALGAHVTVPWQRAALEVLREQAVGPSDGSVGVVVRRHGAGPCVHTDLMANRSVDHDHGGH